MEMPDVTAQSSFRVFLPPHRWADSVAPQSPFGINMALDPDTPDLLARLAAMQEAGIKWGRQDFTWSRIERVKGIYDLAPYEQLVETCRQHGIRLFGNLAYAPPFHDPRLPEGVSAYCAFARSVARRFRGRVDHWQIWNEPNGGFWDGKPEEYARLLALSGKTIHEASPAAKVLGLNMAFCDLLWTEKILRRVPFGCFDIACFHPYRPPSAPEDRLDWWLRDQYVKTWHPEELNEDFPLVHMSFVEQAEELNRVMARFGKPKPLWVTEVCWNTNIHPYGSTELRQAEMLARFYLLALASRKVEKVFWWTLADCGTQQFDMADMVGLMRADLTPKYAYYALATLTRRLEGTRWVRNDAFGPEVYAAVFTDDEARQDLIAAWSTRSFAYLQVTNEQGLTLYDLYGTRRVVPADARTRNLTVPLGTGPVYILGARGLRATVRPDPGW